MSTTIDNEEAGQNLPVGVDESKQLVDAPVQLGASPFSVPVEKTSNHVENVKVEAPAEVKNLEPGSMAVGTPQQEVQNSLCSVPSEANAQVLVETVSEDTSNVKSEFKELSLTNAVIKSDTVVGEKIVDTAETVVDVKPEACGAPAGKTCDDGDSIPVRGNEPTVPLAIHADTKAEIENGVKVKTKVNEELPATVKTKENEELPATVKTKVNEEIPAPPADNVISNTKHSFLDVDYDGNESGTEMEQSAFMKELENFFRERSMEFKPPKFYGEGLNCLKLWRAVTRLGGYDKVTTCKLWRQVGESFKPPKTCTTVSWTFRGFYEKALLDYERHKTIGGELTVAVPPHSESINIENQASASGRARRDAAARAMQGWHSQRLLGNGEVSDPIIKDRTSMPMQKREKQLKSINLLKRKKPSYMDNAVKAARSKPSKPQLDTAVVDIGPPADWVKINVQKTKDCFEVYALVPGLLREEVRVQSDPAGRLVISGEPEHPENPWGVTPFKKVVSLPSRIDPHQTSAVVTLHGQLFVRVPFEQSE